ncbi:MAG: hypothetical protein IJQ26_04030 [Lachnospiraceae bacterium]|nr:hypothetical protein [Lachnospiraceae bacterium]
MSDISRLTVSDCTVGPTKDESFPPGANPIYYNSNIIRYNTQLKEWSAKNNVRVIDLYSFIRSESSILYDRDGVHYLPTPNPVLWKYIISRL